MQISTKRTDKASLAEFGSEVVSLLYAGDIPTLVSRYGYALALGRDSVLAVRQDLSQCLSEIHANGLVLPTLPSPPAVKYFQTNDAGLFAAIECLVSTDSGANLLVELVVSSRNSELHITLEQLSVAA